MLSFYKYLIHVSYSILNMEVIHATVFVLPKTLLFVHLSNSLCNVTLEGLINVKVCLVPILRNFHVCSINEYFTLEKYVFVAMTKNGGITLSYRNNLEMKVTLSDTLN